MALKDILESTKKPHTVTFKQEEVTENYGKFIAQPFERGYATTIGNALRRVLLSSIPGYAISVVRIDGVSNEFENLDGMKEDTIVMLMHLKGVIVSLPSDLEVKELHIKKTGPCVITAKDIAEVSSDITVYNPDLHLATLSEGCVFEMDIQIDAGYGYVSSEMSEGLIQDINIISLDTVYSPVVRVKFDAEDIRIGQRIDYAKLVLEVETNGTISPQKAVSYAAKILRDNLFAFLSPEEAENADNFVKESSKDSELDKIMNLHVEEVEFSVRTANFLAGVDLKTLDKVAVKTESDLLRLPGANEMIIGEIKNKLEQYGAKLGMKNN